LQLVLAEFDAQGMSGYHPAWTASLNTLLTRAGLR
jgi:hypothetical protein